MNDSKELPSIIGKEAFDSGEFVLLTNLFSKEMPMPDTNGLRHRSNYEILESCRDIYGKDNVITGNAFDRETQTASGIPHLFGVYVTKKAYDERQK